MPIPRIFPAPLVVLLLALPAVAQIPEKPGESRSSQYGAEPEPWREQGVSLPPAPQADALAPIESQWFDGRYEYLLDRASVSVGEDGVVRYTVVIRPHSGKQHVIYEGILCGKRAVRMYGLGAGSSLRPVTADWQAIATSGAYVYRRALYESYFCDQDMRTLDVDEIQARLQGERGAGDIGTSNSYYSGRR